MIVRVVVDTTAAAIDSFKISFIRSVSSTSAEHLFPCHPRDLARRHWIQERFPRSPNRLRATAKAVRHIQQSEQLISVCEAHESSGSHSDPGIAKFLENGQTMQAYEYWNTVNPSTVNNVHLELLISKLIDEGKLGEAEKVWALLVKSHPYSTKYPEILLHVYQSNSLHNPILSFWSHLSGLQKRNYVHFLWRAFFGGPDLNGIKLLCTDLKLDRYLDSETMFEKWVIAHDVVGPKLLAEEWFKDAIFYFPLKKNSMRRYRQVMNRLAVVNDVDRIVKLHALVSKADDFPRLFHLSTFSALFSAHCCCPETVWAVFESAVQHYSKLSRDRYMIFQYICVHGLRIRDVELLKFLFHKSQSSNIRLHSRFIIAMIRNLINNDQYDDIKPSALKISKRNNSVKMLLHHHLLLKNLIGVVRFTDIFLELLDMACYHTTEGYNVVLRAFAKCGRIHTAYSLFYLMRKRGIRPSGETYDILLFNGGSRHSFERAISILPMLLEDGFSIRQRAMRLITSGMASKQYALVVQGIFILFDTSLLKKLGISVTLNLPVKVAGKKLPLDKHVFCIFINALSRLYTHEVLTRLYSSLSRLKAEKPDWVINRFIYTPFIREFCRSKSTLPNAISVFQKAIQEDADVQLYSVLLAGLMQFNELTLAERLISVMHANGLRSNLWIYNQLIRGYVKWNHLDRAEKVFKEMLADGVSPNCLTLTAMGRHIDFFFEGVICL